MICADTDAEERELAIVGSPATVRAGLEALAAEYDVGEFMVSGGYTSDDEDGDLIVTINRPLDDSTWQVNAENISRNDIVSFTAYAVCLVVDN